MTDKLNTMAFGTAGGLVAALSMLILGILGKLGFYLGAVEMMRQWHTFFSLTALGILTGMIEAFIITFFFFVIFGWLYNTLNRLQKRRTS